jgi:dTDP-3-amino-3,4,6-trideoxy-alpha-D-glucose transaminase
MDVPFLELKSQYAAIKDEIDAAIARVLERAWFILGAELEAFEAEFAAACGANYCIGVGNGTEALHLALRALGVGPGDEIITVAHTFIATALAISWTGARPVLVEVDPRTYTIDVERAAAAITPSTKALLPVHLYGQPADMSALMELARAHDLQVLEDCAQSHGARYNGQIVGTFGQIGSFSFYPGKNLGAYGDGGALVTNDATLAERLRLLRNYGQTTKYQHEIQGYNSRLDELQAAVLGVKLRYLDTWNERRRALAARYDALLADCGLILPQVASDREHVYHLYAVRSPHRDAMQRHLAAHGIGTLVHYPTPIHLQPAYAGLGMARGALPFSERIADEVLSLPLYPEMSEAQQHAVVAAVQSFKKQ